MSTVVVSSAAELQSALSSAQGGDVISLAAGNYGDVTISKNFSSDVTITSQGAGSPAVFHTLTLNSSSHLRLEGVDVNFTPTSSTYAWSPAVSFSSSSDITFINSRVTGGPAVTGVDQAAASLDSTENVLGLPTGYGILIGKSTGVTISGVEVSQVNKGIVIATSNFVTVANSDIHNTRTTPIVAGGGSHITIDSNHIHDVTPWHWGSGDHADFLAMWTNAGQASASTDIRITNNLMEQGQGTAVLGMWLQGGSVGFSGVTISGNTFLNGNFQGITLWDTSNASVDHNTLLQTSGDSKARPSILLSSGAHNITVSDNITGAVNDQSGSAGTLANTFSNNVLVQKWSAAGAGYYSSDLIARIDQLGDYSSVHSFVLGQVPGGNAGQSAQLPSQALNGGAADDLLVGSSVDNLTVSAGAGADTIYGGQVQSYLRGDDGNDWIVARQGFNDVGGNAGDDTLFGGTGADWLVGGKGNDVINGGSGGQILYGNMGEDKVTGGDGADVVRGGQGDDTISGGAGADWLSGDLGQDVITGGAGADIFHTSANAGVDWVNDFNSAEGDRVLIDAGTVWTLRFDGSNAIIDLGSGSQMVLAGVSQATLGDWLIH
ncbi:MAG TPA: right-handed parallel beta-helix repeat-containing protein [Phenylobacterium sp.]|nr:right-handed parallel beta-helix repeat-containing protein [Phenylobacterium sp.]